MILEKKLGTFEIIYTFKQEKIVAEVHEMDMNGWILYDCFLLPNYHLIQIIAEDGYENLQSFDLEEELEQHALILMEKIRRRA